MTDSESASESGAGVAAPRLRERTIFLLACGGILLLLGLILGLLFRASAADAKGAGEPANMQYGEAPGFEQALFVEGLAPMAVSEGTQFIVRATVINIGEHELRDIQLVIGAHRLIVSVPEGQNATQQIDVLPPGKSRTLEATFKAIEIGRTSITAHALTSNKRIAGARYFEIGVTQDKVEKPEFSEGSAMALRVSMFGPARVDPDFPYEVMTVIENTGQVPLDGVLLDIRPEKGVRSLHSGALDYSIKRLEPGAQRLVRARFQLDGVARGQVRVNVSAAGQPEAPPWTAVEGVHTVVAGSP